MDGRKRRDSTCYYGMVARWLERAGEIIEDRPDAAMVCGRRRERFLTGRSTTARILRG